MTLQKVGSKKKKKKKENKKERQNNNNNKKHSNRYRNKLMGTYYFLQYIFSNIFSKSLSDEGRTRNFMINI